MVHDYLSNLDVGFYITEITKLLQRYEKSINSCRNYAKK